ncbi:MAG: YciI family protein [Actinomycetaceae bacterium]|nr:YciI family protein [Actinomycetaceae bacterium]
MSIFAIEYVYRADAGATMDEIRPDHRAYLSSLAEDGVNLGSGPWVGSGPGALLLFRTESAEKVAELLDADPFAIAGVIESRTIREWNPVLGSLF